MRLCFRVFLAFFLASFGAFFGAHQRCAGFSGKRCRAVAILSRFAKFKIFWQKNASATDRGALDLASSTMAFVYSFLNFLKVEANRAVRAQGAQGGKKSGKKGGKNASLFSRLFFVLSCKLRSFFGRTSTLRRLFRQTMPRGCDTFEIRKI